MLDERRFQLAQVEARACWGLATRGQDGSVARGLSAAWSSGVGCVGCANVVVMNGAAPRPEYQPLTLAHLGRLMSGADLSRRWRLVAEFLEDYRWEAAETRMALLAEVPASTGDEHWDVFLAALAEHLAARDGLAAPAWSEDRTLLQFWFPFNSRAARVDAIVHAPAAFRRRGVYIAPQELEVA